MRDNATSIATKWLIYQHGMTVEQAADVMTGLCQDRSRMAATRQEALDVASFVEDIIEVENGK